jgi:putative tryptophan/tyrosine transport system substrate-binding protein
MRRRDFITAVISAAAVHELHAQQPQPSLPVVGFLAAGVQDQRPYLVPAIRRGLEDAGLVEGRNVAVEYRFAGGRYDRLRGLMDELLRDDAAVIVADGAAAALAAKSASQKIPLVFMIAADPIRLGLVASLNRPGANITGVVMFDTELIAKRLELLRELVRKDAAIALLVNPNNPNAELLAREIEASRGATGQIVQVVGASSEAELETAFTDLRRRQVAGIVVAADPFLDDHLERQIALSLRYTLPAIYLWRQFPEAGGLISYGPSLAETYRQVALYAGRILKGAKPSDLPVAQPTKVELVINLKTAKTLGLTIPPLLLARVDDVIE